MTGLAAISCEHTLDETGPNFDAEAAGGGGHQEHVPDLSGLDEETGRFPAQQLLGHSGTAFLAICGSILHQMRSHKRKHAGPELT